MIPFRHLSEVTSGRDNNLNLLRLSAALAVLISHSFVVVTGTEKSEPLLSTLGMTWGSIAVDVFFVTSGFLVTASLLSRKNTLNFIFSRVLRIYPALITMVIVSVVILGIFFTKLSIAEFLKSPATWTYVFKNTTLWFGVTGYLPEVFDTVPFANKVNASLWTLPIEVRMYGILAVLWFLLYPFGRLRQRIASLIIVALASAGLIIHLRDFFLLQAIDQFHRLFYMFFSGGTFYILKSYIPLSRTLFLSVASILLLSTINKEVFFLSYHLFLAYIVIWIAYVPEGAIRKFNKLGDYSYGVYIYAFPIQQSFIAFFPGSSVELLILSSSAITLLFAFLSWHLIERRALEQKQRLTFIAEQTFNTIQLYISPKSNQNR